MPKDSSQTASRSKPAKPTQARNNHTSAALREVRLALGARLDLIERDLETWRAELRQRDVQMAQLLELLRASIERLATDVQVNRATQTQQIQQHIDATTAALDTLVRHHIATINAVRSAQTVLPGAPILSREVGGSDAHQRSQASRPRSPRLS